MDQENIEITPDMLAARWCMSVNTLRVWRSQKRGICYNKRGGKVTYSMADILEYEAKNKIIHENTS